MKIAKRTLSVLLSASMLLSGAAASLNTVPVYAAAKKESKKNAKYIKDVFIAYGKTEENAKTWLIENGWEPVPGKNTDFNAGKKSSDNKEVAAVMGIRRTSDVKEAITDMAVMNMTGRYDFAQYDDLVKQKKAEIDEFIYSFIPAIEEFRLNYNGEGSEAGQMRAEMAYELLNKFYDGSTKEKYAVNDTGMQLGDLFLDTLMQEGGGNGSGDLQQILLEGSAPAVSAVENALALAADSSDDTWLERLEYLTMQELRDNVDIYVPEAEGTDVAPSAEMQYYMLAYGDVTDELADRWDGMHKTMQWYDDYTKEHDLGMHDGESAEEYEVRTGAILDELKAEESVNSEAEPGEVMKYIRTGVLYEGLYSVPYSGVWGETLGDFFNPAGDCDIEYAGDSESYLPMAVALSEGQRSSVSLLSMDQLLMAGLIKGDGIEDIFADVDEILGENESISVYSGVNRGIFRDGVALTSKTMEEMSRGEEVPALMEEEGMSKALYISLVVTSCITVAVGAAVLSCGVYQGFKTGFFKSRLEGFMQNREYYSISSDLRAAADRKAKVAWGKLDETEQFYKGLDRSNHITVKLSVGIILTGIGAALICYSLAMQISEACENYEEYHNRNFTRIPAMIVDEQEIVSYVDKDGEKERCVEFDQYSYYEAVRCNRQEVGELGGWQNGVKDYEEQGCGDVADLNADQGLEWLALYTVKGHAKGAKPILADKLSLTYGEKKDTDTSALSLHYLDNGGKADLADRAYCYSNEKGSIYFNWDIEE